MFLEEGSDVRKGYIRDSNKEKLRSERLIFMVSWDEVQREGEEMRISKSEDKKDERHHIS